jgi:hypothetical protein
VRAARRISEKTFLSKEKRYLYQADHEAGDNFVRIWTFFVAYLHEPFFTFTYWFTSTSFKDMEPYNKAD